MIYSFILWLSARIIHALALFPAGIAVAFLESAARLVALADKLDLAVERRKAHGH